MYVNIFRKYIFIWLTAFSCMVRAMESDESSRAVPLPSRAIGRSAVLQDELKESFNGLISELKGIIIQQDVVDKVLSSQEDKRLSDDFDACWKEMAQQSVKKSKRPFRAYAKGFGQGFVRGFLCGQNYALAHGRAVQVIDPESQKEDSISADNFKERYKGDYRAIATLFWTKGRSNSAQIKVENEEIGSIRDNFVKKLTLGFHDELSREFVPLAEGNIAARCHYYVAGAVDAYRLFLNESFQTLPFQEKQPRGLPVTHWIERYIKQNYKNNSSLRKPHMICTREFDELLTKEIEVVEKDNNSYAGAPRSKKAMSFLRGYMQGYNQCWRDEYGKEESTPGKYGEVGEFYRISQEKTLQLFPWKNQHPWLFAGALAVPVASISLITGAWIAKRYT